MYSDYMVKSCGCDRGNCFCEDPVKTTDGIIREINRSLKELSKMSPQSSLVEENESLKIQLEHANRQLKNSKKYKTKHEFDYIEKQRLELVKELKIKYLIIKKLLTPKQLMLYNELEDKEFLDILKKEKVKYDVRTKGKANSPKSPRKK